MDLIAFSLDRGAGSRPAPGRRSRACCGAPCSEKQRPNAPHRSRHSGAGRNPVASAFSEAMDLIAFSLDRGAGSRPAPGRRSRAGRGAPCSEKQRPNAPHRSRHSGAPRGLALRRRPEELLNSEAGHPVASAFSQAMDLIAFSLDRGAGSRLAPGRRSRARRGAPFPEHQCPKKKRLTRRKKPSFSGAGCSAGLVEVMATWREGRAWLLSPLPRSRGGRRSPRGSR